VDAFIFTSAKLSSHWDVAEKVFCKDCGWQARGYGWSRRPITTGPRRSRSFAVRRVHQKNPPASPSGRQGLAAAVRPSISKTSRATLSRAFSRPEA
jgi:hypothetical protein